MIRLHLAPGLGRLPLVKLTPEHVEALLAAKRAAGFSPRMAQLIHATLRCALKTALKRGYVASLVASLVDVLAEQRPEVRPLTPTEARQFLAAVQGDRLGGLYALALGCGLRLGEAVGITWTDVNLDAATLTVRRTLQRIPDKAIEGKPKSRLVEGEPKSARSRRVMALPPFVVAALKARRQAQREERVKVGPLWQESGYVFTTAAGGPLEPRNVTRSFKLALSQAKLPASVRVYDLRHSAASLLGLQGVAPRVVMETLGHSDIRVTMNLYRHVFEEAKQQAADKMDALLGSRAEAARGR